MEMNNYNIEDKKYKHVIKLLKQLPKVNAPDDFEFKLRIKIENGEFDLEKENKIEFNPWKILTPAAGFITVTIFAFIIFSNNSENLDNPFHSIPKIRSEYSGNLLDSSNLTDNLGENNRVTNSDVIVTEENERKVAATPAPKLKKPDFPFDDKESMDLDAFLTGNQKRTNLDGRASLAVDSRFKGFYIGEEVNKEYVERLRARIDSLNRLNIEQRKNRK